MHNMQIGKPAQEKDGADFAKGYQIVISFN